PAAAPRPPRIAVVLAAGLGTRMKSALPKVLHPAAGRPLLAWVLEAARSAACERLVVVVGHGAEAVRKAFAAPDVEFVLQAEQRGTGHALAQVEGRLRSHPDQPATLVVLSGDAPLVTPATIEALAARAEAGWGALAVAELAEPGALGRVFPAPDGGLAGIVEARDATSEQLQERRINAGLYALPAPEIFEFLDRLRPSNAQGELYLTDTVTDAARAGRRVDLHPLDDPSEAWGVNDRVDLARVHRRLIDRHLERLMRDGVTILEPARTSIEPGVEVGRETLIHPEVSLSGGTSIGAGCVLGQGAWIRDSRLSPGVVVEPYSTLDGAEVEAGCRVGREPGRRGRHLQLRRGGQAPDRDRPRRLRGQRHDARRSRTRGRRSHDRGRLGDHEGRPRRGARDRPRPAEESSGGARAFEAASPSGGGGELHPDERQRRRRPVGAELASAREIEECAASSDTS